MASDIVRFDTQPPQIMEKLRDDRRKHAPYALRTQAINGGHQDYGQPK